MLELPDSWIWDFWFADTGAEYHVFFLRASRALHDPDRRHRRASVGHAVSTDLRHWELLADAIVPADEPRWDDLAIWTGSVIDGPDGVWRMFYTALSRADHGAVQRIGVATSTDLTDWTTRSEPLVVADGRWYEQLGDGVHDNEFWRDPWVFAADGAWHMLITARGRSGEAEDRGVLGHAVSDDLEHWRTLPPASSTGAGFSQLEVPQTVVVDGTPTLVFSCLGPELAGQDRQSRAGGVWALAAPSLTGPFDVAGAHRLLDESFYVGRLVADRDGHWQVLAFHNIDAAGRFGGRLSDPMPVHWVSPGVLSTRC
jgi:beta-fructofuranosidase